jgi:hypothetical protein
MYGETVEKNLYYWYNPKTPNSLPDCIAVEEGTIVNRWTKGQMCLRIDRKTMEYLIYIWPIGNPNPTQWQYLP